MGYAQLLDPSGRQVHDPCPGGRAVVRAVGRVEGFHLPDDQRPPGRDHPVEAPGLGLGQGVPCLFLTGALALLERAEHEHFAYVEGPETSALYSNPETISLLSQRHGMIRIQALNPEDSAAYLAEVEEQL